MLSDGCARLVTQFLDYNVLPTAQGHLKMNHTSNFFSTSLQTQVSKSQWFSISTQVTKSQVKRRTTALNTLHTTANRNR